MHPTLVVRRNSSTAPTALTSHKSLTDGVAWSLPPAHPPHVFPQSAPLLRPRRAPREQVMPRLLLSTHTPPTLGRVCLSEPPAVCPCRRMPRKELVVAAGECPSGPPKWWFSKASPRRGPVSSLGSYMCPDPLCRLLGSSLGCDRHVRKGCLRGVSLRYGLHRFLPGGRTLCISVRHLVAGSPTVCWDPSDGDAVVVGCDAGADLNGRHREALARAQGVVPHSRDGGRGVDENGLLAAALLLSIEGVESPVDGKGLGIEELYMG